MYQDAAIQASLKKVEAAREANIRLDPPRMSAEEKDALLKTYHPDYRESQFTTLLAGPNKGEKGPLELAELLQGKSRLEGVHVDLSGRTIPPTFSSSAAAERALLQPLRPTTTEPP